MSKIFRLYTGGAETYQGWNNSPTFPYNSANRDTIEDPDGASARHEITSIPSPYARIDLVKTAFKEVCKPRGRNGRPDFDGDTIFHKMVSDTLDVGEIFFNIDRYKDKVEVITWQVDSMIQELMQDGNTSHFYLADALAKYKKSDAQTYNFGMLNNIYLLNYLNGPDELNIIGATSPATLFFSSANDLSYVNDLYFNTDKPFDSEYQPLYKRDFEYIKAWFTFRKTTPNFATLFPEIEAYLNETFRLINDPAKKNELNALNENSVSSFSEIEAIDEETNARHVVEILGISWFKKQSRPVQSEFTIEPTIKQEGTLPLVLPVESGNKYKDLAYTTGNWGTTNAAPFYDPEENVANRALPFDGSKCPYLTISDLLEENLIKVPHTLNKKQYFDCNFEISEPKLSYLIPVKPLLLQYFNIQDLCSEVSDGQKMIEMSSLAGGSIKVTLRVPVCGNKKVSYIEYTRIYYNGREADETRNEGGIIEFDFAGHIMPLVKFNNPEDALYSVSCVSTFSRKFELNFYLGASKLHDINPVFRNEDGAYTYKSNNYTIEGSNFDYIQVSDKNGASGLIVPKFKQQRSINAFDFSIDLGTSNTHIEFKSQNAPNSEPFAYDSDSLAAHMFVHSYFRGFQDDLIDEMAILEKDFVPLSIGNSDFKFPTRTILSCAQSINWHNAQAPYALYNIPLTYDKRRDLPYNNLLHNIKWGRGIDQAAMEAYVECLMLMLRNKVLLNDGDLHRTKITWFYPISMSPNRVQRLRQTWNRVYKKLFDPNQSTIAMTESAAPIVYYFGRYATATNLVNIDMGGGTTDIAFAKNREIQYVTSFKFATNALFEDAFSQINTQNGIVDFHKGKILQLLQERNISELVDIFNSSNNATPANMASFLFSLKGNSIIKREGINPNSIDFNALLSDDDNFKIAFVLYYTAIIYHVANIVKVKKLAEPRHIAFSGNGSKVIKIITTDTKLLAKFTKAIFEEVLGHKYTCELDILGLDDNSNPKESTCKGGIIGLTDDGTEDNIIILKGDNSNIVGKESVYNDIDSKYRSKIIASVEEFFDFAFNTLDRIMDFDKCFGVSKGSLDIAKEVCKKDLTTYLDKGIAQRADQGGTNAIEETTFFYPIKGVINALSNSIYESLKEH